MLQPRLVSPIKTRKGLQLVLSQIDEKILKLSVKELNRVRFGFNDIPSYEVYHDLIMYRSILQNLALGCSCIRKYNTDQIISKVNSLIKSC